MKRAKYEVDCLHEAEETTTVHRPLVLQNHIMRTKHRSGHYLPVDE